MYFIVVVVLCNGCNDYTRELSGGYFYWDEGGQSRAIQSHHSENESVWGEVLDYDYSSEYIVILQCPSHDEYVNMVAFYLEDDTLRYPQASRLSHDKSEHDADSIVSTDPRYTRIFANKYNYWIVSHKAHKVFGPYTKTEYWQKRKELDVPECLELRDEPK